MKISDITTFLILLVFAYDLEAANPQPKPDLRNSNFKELLRGGGSGGISSGTGISPPSSSPQVSQPQQAAPAASNPAGIPYCDEVQNSAQPSSSSSPVSAPANNTPNSTIPSSPSGAQPSSNQQATSTSTSSAPSSQGSSNAGSSDSSGGAAGQSPTYEQFCEAVDAYSLTSAGGHPPKPSKEIYDAFLKNVSAKKPLKEQAMFLANCIWETGGLQYMKEIACSNGSCTYGKYYGRGFIQLTWDYNYREASKDIYGDDSLFNNPDLAAAPDGAWKTALWFWDKRVSPVLKQNNAVETYKLGYSIKVINGGLECPANQKAQNRMAIFNQILSVWNIDKNKPGKMEGC